jgi:hypothetical protein
MAAVQGVEEEVLKRRSHESGEEYGMQNEVRALGSSRIAALS